MNLSGVILAGGQSSRLKKDKCRLYLHGERVLERTVRILEELTQEIILVLSPQQPSPLPNSHFKVKEVADFYPGKGPLVGLYSGLSFSKNPYSLAVACDMPFLNPRLLHHMLDLSPGFDVVVPRVEDKAEPLHAVYSKNCLGIIEKMLKQGDLKLRNLLDRVKVKYIEGEKLKILDPEHLSFFNINSSEDLIRAEFISREGR